MKISSHLNSMFRAESSFSVLKSNSISCYTPTLLTVATRRMFLIKFWQLFANFSQSRTWELPRAEMSNYESIHSLGIWQVSQQANDYGKFFASFLLENVSYDGFVSSIKKYSSSLALLDEDKTTLTYRDCRDEDGDTVNVCQTYFFGVFPNAS